MSTGAVSPAPPGATARNAGSPGARAVTVASPGSMRSATAGAGTIARSSTVRARPASGAWTRRGTWPSRASRAPARPDGERNPAAPASIQQRAGAVKARPVDRAAAAALRCGIMRPVWLLVLAVAAAGFRPPLRFPPPGGLRGGRPRAAAQPALEPPAGASTFDTASGVLFTASSTIVARSTLTIDEGAVLYVDAFQLDAGATLAVIGPRPLVIASRSTIAIDGTLDAGSHLGTQLGAGADQACTANAGGNGGNAPATGGAGGGGGGGQQGTGGAGAAGGSGSAAAGPGGPAVTPTSSVTALRGGCPGGASGLAGPSANAPASPASIAPGGDGGGAIRL